jgi:hypothetical protein
MTTVLEASLQYIEQGFSIVPCHGKEPAKTDKGQFPWSTCQVKRPTFAHVHGWHDKGWLQNVAIVCGEISNNLVVIDLDGKEAVDEFEGEFRGLCKDTRIIQSGSGEGKHIYVYCKELPHTTRTKGFELRANGCYVVAPPSIHPDSKQPYRVLCGAPIRTFENLNVVVKWIREKLASKTTSTSAVNRILPTSGYGQAALTTEITRLRTTTNGNRNNQLNLSAFRLGQLVAENILDRSQVENFLLGASLAMGLTEKESVDTINSGLSAGIRKPRGTKVWYR